ncbi:hypothetical protein L0U85_00485 [Glycomyces sp. L485]|uniref:hypothetical protein n=1 Tax=Glycomyces sp. L485 TaxID=2909235 RepID=UPI001F4A7E0A|nr:hypothetical protein [Glycomyces sp. L485]MCH7229345.1 hypothetical protein [Glycomyces sp. L485]
MTYPPAGGYDPQQYHVSSQPPQQPSDPYAQGYNAPPPQPNYGPGPAQYPPPNMTPPIGVQPGYPQGPPLPPPIPPAQQGPNLGIVLGVIVGLVVLLGVAAVLIVPGMLEDDDPVASGGETTETEDEPATEDTTEAEEQPSEEEDSGELQGWGEPVSSEDFEPNSPEGAAISWVVAADKGDNDTLDSLICAKPTSDMEWQLDYQKEYGGAGYDFIIWSVSREENGDTLAWANWTWDDGAPDEDDMDSGYTYTVVEEDGQWKLCDAEYGS